MALSFGYTFSSIAEEYEDKEDWHKAIDAHNDAAVHFEQALIEQTDSEIRQQLETLRKAHLHRAKELMDKNVFDMKTLKKEINEIRQDDLFFASEEEDAKDPFNKFWGVVEPMVDKLSNSVVLTSANINESNSISNPVYYDTADNTQETDRIQREMSSISESFFMSPSLSSKIDTPQQKSPKEENEELKTQLASLKNQINELEKKSIDSTVLKSSIIQFKNDVHKQALLIFKTQENSMMTRSATTTWSMPSKNIRHAGSSTAEIVNRIKELEEGNRILRSQNRKQDALMSKYRERWEKLKEGAKKRQPSTSSTTSTNLLSTLASHTPPSSINLPPK